MWPKYACIVKTLPMRDAGSVQTDPDVAAFLENAGERLGNRGRLVIRLSGIPQENRVLAEGKTKRVCRQCLQDLEQLLIRKGYME